MRWELSHFHMCHEKKNASPTLHSEQELLEVMRHFLFFPASVTFVALREFQTSVQLSYDFFLDTHGIAQRNQFASNSVYRCGT